MPPSWYQSPPASSMPVAGETIPRQNPAVIRKSGLEIKNQCTKEGVNGEIPAAIRKSGPEIKNRCMKDGGNRENPAAIPKLTPSNQESPHEAADLRHASSAHPPARVQARVLPCMFCMGRVRAGLTVAAKAGADAPGGGISLCFCRRGCAAPALKAATLNSTAW